MIGGVHVSDIIGGGVFVLLAALVLFRPERKKGGDHDQTR